MPGFSFRTNLDADESLQAVARAAKRLEFRVSPLNDRELSVQKGSFTASVLVGPLLAYCDFRVSVESRRDGTVEILLERNNPWWAGIIARNRIASRAKELNDEKEKDVIDRQGKILGRDTF